GYPTDYLVSRIRGRRGGLTRDWRSPIETGVAPGVGKEEPWSGLLKEYFWVYRQMNGRLRTIFGPLFLFFEMKTLVLCLRNKGARDMSRVAELLNHSLLCDQIRKALLKEEELAETIRSLAATLTHFSGRFEGMEEIYGSEGLRAFEERLARTCLEYFRQSKLHPLVEAFFVRLIDLRNLMSCYKHLRWKIEEAPPYIPGGRMGESELRGLVAGENMEKVLKSKRAGDREAGIDVVLLRELTAQVQEGGKEAVGIGVILDYIWRRYIEARNRMILLHGKALDPHALAREMIA
ncbi:MAG: V-type ATPase subunit, partial [bacterium]|nr:V-type ATPase subunit [bacterium]